MYLCQAEACKSVEHAFKRSPHGMLAEIKYDGERVQVHKSGGTFKYFSRSLKPVVPHKVMSHTTVSRFTSTFGEFILRLVL